MRHKVRQVIDTTLFKYRLLIMVSVLLLFIVGISYIFMAMDLSLYEKQILGIVFVIAILSSVFSSALGRVSRHVPDQDDMWFNRDATNWLADWLAGISTEMIGALITTVLLGIILSQLEVKDTLIEQIHSQLEQNAVQALEDMRVYGWLTDGTLRGESLKGVTWVDADLRQADLRDANLANAVLQRSDLSHAFFQRANLEGADLSDADLSYVSMQDADLSQTDLSGITALDGNLSDANLFWSMMPRANLSRANLTNAILIGVDLQDSLAEGAVLRGADLSGSILQNVNLQLSDLQGAKLDSVNLSGAYLVDANLERAALENVAFDSDTTLPDGTRWTDSTDMARFTDANHPNFWRSDNPDSPAWGTTSSAN